MTSVSLIIPALNEEEPIGGVLDSLDHRAFAQVIVVDNGSTDRTAAVARARGATVVAEPNRGYGRACQAGIRNLSATCEIVVFMDADGSDDPGDLPRILAPILNGHADMVIGARRGTKVQKGSLTPHQMWGNRLACWMIRVLYGQQCTDLGPFRAIRRERLMSLGMNDPTFGWNAEMQVKACLLGLRVHEVEVGYRPRIGVSKISGNLKNSILAGAKILWMIARLRV